MLGGRKKDPDANLGAGVVAHVVGHRLERLLGPGRRSREQDGCRKRHDGEEPPRCDSARAHPAQIKSHDHPLGRSTAIINALRKGVQSGLGP